MAVRKSAAKKTVKTAAARRTRAMSPRVRAAKRTRRRPTAPRTVAATAPAAAIEKQPEAPRLVAVLPVPMATFVF
jgi:hypothetical protein